MMETLITAMAVTQIALKPLAETASSPSTVLMGIQTRNATTETSLTAMHAPRSVQTRPAVTDTSARANNVMMETSLMTMGATQIAQPQRVVMG
jgi:uncharacterized protein